MSEVLKPNIALSPSVQSVVDRYRGHARISSWEFTQALLRNHSEYAGGMGEKLASEPGPEALELRQAEEWLESLQNLFDPSRVQELHGRLAILGLSMLDAQLRAHLQRFGILAALEKELKEPWSALVRKGAQEAFSNRNAPSSSRKATKQQPTQSNFSAVEPEFTQSNPPEDNPSAPPAAEPAPSVSEPDNETVAASTTLAAGYISDAINPGAVDHLDIEREVANIAYVLTSRRVSPPLSLGLFGDWGSGKSFFMAKLRKYISDIANYYRDKERAEKKTHEWCSRVVQIEFNAWHFSDANLWASLVTRIYDALHQELSDKTESDKVLRERLTREAQRAQGVVGEAEVQLAEIKERVSHATVALQEAKVNRQSSESKLNGLIGDVKVLLREDEKTRATLDQAAKALGFPEAARTYAELEGLSADLKSLSSRISAVTASIFRSPWTLVVLALLVIVLPVALSLFMEKYLAQLSAVGKRVTEISTFIFALITWLKVQMSRGLAFVETIENGLEKARAVRVKRISESEEVQQAQQMLDRAQSEEQAARQNLENTQTELQRLQSELREMKPERRLYRLIEERGKAATYTQHLGIISLIRADFEKMSALLNELAVDHQNTSEEAPPIQRIILYIDDLDRCRTERVVEVLEAVHLLLAFPLFIVVVGVDPRWLRHSLAQHYSRTLSINGNAADGKAAEEPSYSTPQDYLEKIFQIPFALRPVDRSGYQNLVADLLKPLPERLNEKPPAHETDNGRTRSPEANADAAAVLGTDAAVVPSTSTNATREVAIRGIGDQPPAPREQTFIPLHPKQLDFTAWEKRDIAFLWRMFRTPRTVKRFINTYRLLRAGLAPGGETALFEGNEHQPGEYQVALLLLAIVASAPNETETFLHTLGDWLNQQQPEDNKTGLWKWSDLIHALKNPLQEQDSDWKEIMSDLENIAAEGFSRTFNKETLRKWAWRVARYSFSVHPAQALSTDTDLEKSRKLKLESRSNKSTPSPRHLA